MGEKERVSGSVGESERETGTVASSQNQHERVDLYAKALQYLEESIDLCVLQLRSSKLKGRAKQRWAHCLAQQVAALVNLRKVAGEGDEEDMALFLAKVRERLPKKYRRMVSVSVSKKLRRCGQ